MDKKNLSETDKINFISETLRLSFEQVSAKTATKEKLDEVFNAVSKWEEARIRHKKVKFGCCIAFAPALYIFCVPPSPLSLIAIGIVYAGYYAKNKEAEYENNLKEGKSWFETDIHENRPENPHNIPS